MIATSPNYIESSRSLAPYRSKCVSIPLGIDLEAFEPKSEVAVLARKLRDAAARPARLCSESVGSSATRVSNTRSARWRSSQTRSSPSSATGLCSKTCRAWRASSGGRSTASSGPIVGSSPRLLPRERRLSSAFDRTAARRSRSCRSRQWPAASRSSTPSSTPGVPFVSPHGETGLTVRPEDPQALAAAVRSLLASPETRKQLGEAGRRRARTEFSKEKLAGAHALPLPRALCIALTAERRGCLRGVTVRKPRRGRTRRQRSRGALYFVGKTELERVRGLPVDAESKVPLFADACRLNALYMIARAGSGHIGSSFPAWMSWPGCTSRSSVGERTSTTISIGTSPRRGTTRRPLRGPHSARAPARSISSISSGASAACPGTPTSEPRRW